MAEQRPAAARRIVRAEAVHVRVPFRRPLLDATGEYTHRRAWLLRLVDDAGGEGLGEATLSPTAQEVTTAALASLMRRLVATLVDGPPPSDSELLAEGEPGRAAMAGISGALGMLSGRGPSAPEARGAHQEAISIPVVATIAFGGPAAGAEAAAQAVQLGFGTLELRAGFERQTDQLVARLRAIRAAVGPEPRLRIDAAGAWDLETAAERIAAAAAFRIEHVEQPLAAWDLAGHAALRERVHVPIALDESLGSEGTIRAALAERAADVLVLKPARLGGEAPTVRAAQAAAAAGVSVVLGSYYETGVGIAAALRIGAGLRDGGRGASRGAGAAPAHGLATAGVLSHDLLRTPIPIENGAMPFPAVIALDEAEVGRLALERVEAPRG